MRYQVYAASGTHLATCANDGDALAISRRHGKGCMILRADASEGEDDLVWHETFDTFALDAFERMALLRLTVPA